MPTIFVRRPVPTIRRETGFNTARRGNDPRGSLNHDSNPLFCLLPRVKLLPDDGGMTAQRVGGARLCVFPISSCPSCAREA